MSQQGTKRTSIAALVGRSDRHPFGNQAASRVVSTGPWLCVPTSRSVCPFEDAKVTGLVLSHGAPKCIGLRTEELRKTSRPDLRPAGITRRNRHESNRNPMSIPPCVKPHAEKFLRVRQEKMRSRKSDHPSRRIDRALHSGSSEVHQRKNPRRRVKLDAEGEVA